ncbi:hypothetical protein APA_446 [Pseudanabaena sp. lw0831]|nr:hypothetical protein APA_446 [Pseudanabaena sp. lw0831]
MTFLYPIFVHNSYSREIQNNIAVAIRARAKPKTKERVVALCATTLSFGSQNGIAILKIGIS